MAIEPQIDPRMLEGLQGMERPIPGQSLTNDPDNPAPFEKAPKHSNVRKAQEDIFEKIIQEEVYIPVMQLLQNQEATIMEVTQNLLYAGFRAGQWNPDLMILLAEPTAYMFMALAERAQIDYVINDDDDEVEAEKDAVLGSSQDQGRMDKLQEAIAAQAPTSTDIKLPKEIRDRLDEAPVDSLLAPTEEEPKVVVPEGEKVVEEAPPESLLG